MDAKGSDAHALAEAWDIIRAGWTAWEDAGSPLGPNDDEDVMAYVARAIAGRLHSKPAGEQGHAALIDQLTEALVYLASELHDGWDTCDHVGCIAAREALSDRAHFIADQHFKPAGEQGHAACHCCQGGCTNGCECWDRDTAGPRSALREQVATHILSEAYSKPMVADWTLKHNERWLRAADRVIATVKRETTP